MIIQAPPETLLHWLYTNAPAAWVSALVAIVTCGFLLRSRKKPNRLVFREVRNTSLVHIWPSVRRRIKMTFDDKPIEKLGQIDGDIFNEGSEVIHRPTLGLTLSEKSVVLGVQVTPQDLDAQSNIDRNVLTITLPYLNPVREHGQIVKLSLLLEGDTEGFSVAGGGEGWSVRHSRLYSPKRELYWDIGVLVCFFIILGVSYAYGRYVERTLGIPMSEVSWRAFVSSLPILILIIVVLGIWLARKLSLFFRRRRRIA